MVDAAMARWFTDRFKQQKPGRWKQMRDTILGTSPQGYIGCATAIQNFDFSAKAAAIKTPTLVARGSDDAGATPAESQRLVSLIPNAKYEEFPGARHVGNVEMPDVFNRIMMSWLATHR
jgi:3-oxoadipate enol-lactonase